MTKHESAAQKQTVQRVMHEFKHGELKGGTGGKVKTPKQAIAIALHEAGASNQETPAKNKTNLRKTKGKEARGQTAQAEAEGGKADATREKLYDEAKRRNISGRSKMSKDQLQHALRG